MKKVMFISSGGGHLNELLQLSPLFKKYQYSLITEKTETTLYLKDKYHNVSYLLYGTKEHLFKYLFIFSFNIIKSLWLFIKYQPDAVVTTGTHTAVPMCYIAHFMRKKVIYIETFANAKTPTKAGPIIHKVADKFIVQWPEMIKFYDKAEYWGWIF